MDHTLRIGAIHRPQKWLCCALLDNAKLFSSVDISVDISTRGMAIENGKNLAFCNTVGVKCCIIMVLICISLITSEQLFKCLSAILCSSVNA